MEARPGSELFASDGEHTDSITSVVSFIVLEALPGAHQPLNSAVISNG